MPLYDFRCADCKGEREVRVPFEHAGFLELICIDCGGAMTKAISKTVNLAMRSSSAASPSPATPGRRNGKRRSCSDKVVKLTRPNPFAKKLPSRAAGNQGE